MDNQQFVLSSKSKSYQISKAGKDHGVTENQKGRKTETISVSTYFPCTLEEENNVKRFPW